MHRVCTCTHDGYNAASVCANFCVYIVYPYSRHFTTTAKNAFEFNEWALFPSFFFLLLSSSFFNLSSPYPPLFFSFFFLLARLVPLHILCQRA